ncbi:MAG TPA: winged helix-turn-helix transcriptional regulator [Candidatus Thermoplasmatota archaeon]|nr:winged helix-turn-helix transcriptional regulator [Candidatus Thermoplasmatota archaeon]
MQGARLSAFVALALAPLAAASSPEPFVVQFAAPAQFDAHGQAEGLEWALLFFQAGGASVLDLRGQGTARAVNHTTVLVGADQPPVATWEYEDGLPARSHDLPDAFQAALAFQSDDWSSLYVEADRLTFTHGAANGTAIPIEAGDQLAGVVPRTVPPFVFRSKDLLAPHAGAGLALQRPGAAPFAFQLVAQGLRRVEYANAQVSCPSGQACVDGAGPFRLVAPTPGGNGGAVLHPIMEVATGGALAGHGSAAFAALGGPRVTLGEDGSARLPLATRVSPCAGACLDPQGQTLRLRGNLTLAGLEGLPGDAPRLSARLSGTFTAANLDEAPVPAHLLGVGEAVAVVGGVALVALLVKALLALFSRELTPETALATPGRRRVYEAVCSNPGAMYRAIMEAAGVSDSMSRHHLKKLQAVGLVVAQDYAGTVRYFENHGRYAATWKGELALRDPDLRRLMEWLTRHPGQTQRELSDALGAARSVVQRRLRRLEDWGLVVASRSGRTKRYRLA